MKKDSLLFMSLGMLLRFLTYHILALLAVLGVMAFLPDGIGAFIAQIFGLGIITVLPFMPAFQVGMRDSNKIRYQNEPYNRFKGLVAGIIGYAPFILAALAIIVAKLGWISDAYLPFYRLISAPFMPLIQTLMPTALTLNEMSVANVLICAATCIIPPISVALGYWQGANRLSLSEEFGGKKEK